MQDKEELVLVEVRYRTKNDYDSALDSVDENIIQKLVSAASHYVSRHQPDLLMRFDVIGCDSSLKT